MRERLRAPDAYGFLLAAIALAALAAGTVGSLGFGRVIVAGLLSSVLLFAFWTSRVSRRIQRIAVAVVVVNGAHGRGRLTLGSARFASAIVGGADAFLAITALVAILRRLASHVVISGHTVAGAACAYLLIGIFFMSVFTFLAATGEGPFYAQTASERSVDHLYFSFVTLTTVGFGDLTPIADLSRMIAVSEALIGQLFLVTVVALVVGNMGRTRLK
jgi:Ion channel